MFSCPNCREENDYEADVRRVYVSDCVTGGASATLAEKDEEIKQLKEKVAQLEISCKNLQDKIDLAQPSGSRRGQFEENKDATCFNCDSSQHETRNCPLPCYIR